MKSYPVLALCIASLSCVAALRAETKAPATCTTLACCKQVQANNLADFDAAILAQPSEVAATLAKFAGKDAACTQKLAVRAVTTFSQKLPADKLGAALHAVMQASVRQLAEATPIAPVAAGTSDADRREAALSQDLKLAGAVHELTHAAIDAVKQNLAAPSPAVSDSAELVIDPQAFASLMKGSMEQVLRGSIAGLGERAAGIPVGYLPSLASLRQDSGSYSYSLQETAIGERLPSAVAAPVEEPAKK